jgi:D-sedoheptulose 7-phosphate isomerase
MGKTPIISGYVDKLKKALDNLNHEEINGLGEILKSAQARGNAIYILGNGGSAAAASHLSCDLNKGASYGYEKRYHAFALSDNISALLAFANDVSYDDVFIEQLKNCLRENDVVIGLSGSGNSKNILKAVEYADAQGAVTVGITGYTTGKLSEIAGYNVNLNIDDMQIAEDLHIVINHILVNLLTEDNPKAV